MSSLTLAMSTLVAASPARVWSCLTHPDQIRRWRPGALAMLDPAPAEPAPGRVLRLRCRITGVPVVLEERALEVAREERLHSSLRVGLFHCEETFTLAPAGAGARRTRVGLRLVTSSEAPLVGEGLDRFEVRRFAAELASGSLAALRRCCEAERGAEVAETTHRHAPVREAR